MDKIVIKNLEIFAKHGVFPEENVLGQKFIVSTVLHINTRIAGLTDDLEKTINYGEVCFFIKKFMEEHTFKLLEAVAEQLVMELLFSFPLLEQIDLEIQKPWAPISVHLETVSIQISRKWHIAFIGLGSNIGDKKNYLDMAVKMLRNNHFCQVLKVADYIITKPYGNVEQDDFLNSALMLRTLFSPEELLDELQKIENIAGRERTIRWGPRTLDLDILLYDDLIMDKDDLHIPHIELHKRDFVLSPLAQIAPYLRHPLLGNTILELKNKLNSLDA